MPTKKDKVDAPAADDAKETKQEETKTETPKADDKKTEKPKTKAKATPKKKDDDSVSVPKKTLQDILDRLESVEETNKNLTESNKKKDQDIEMLRSISDQGRLAKYEQKENGELIRTAKVGFWEGLPILGWQSVTDEVGYREGKIIVNQIIRIFLDEIDEKTSKPRSVDLNYLYWSQNVEMREGEVVAKLEENGHTFWTIQLEDGRKIKLDTRFINAF